MYGDSMQQQQLPPLQNQHLVGDLHRGSQMMRQPSASSTNINPDYHHSFAPNHFESHVDSFGGKRIKKHTQRRPVDYTSTVVKYIQVHICLSLSAYLYSVEGVGMKVVWNTLDMWSLILVDDVLMDRLSFSSTFVRSLPAVCRFFVVSSLAFGAVILFFSSWWQLKGKFIGIFHLVNMLLMDTDFWVVSCLEQFLFPIFPFVWSELEAHVLLVLKGSFFQLMPISAFGAVIVIFWITLDASIQEVYEIVMQFLWFLAVICINSIPCFISFLLLLALCGVVVSFSNGV